MRSPLPLGALAVLLLPSAVPAQDPFAGRATVGTETVTFDAPTGAFDAAAARVSVSFKSARSGATILADFTFTPGSASAMAEQMKSCRVSFRGFKRPLELSGGVRECHVSSIGGFLRPGGALIGLIEGAGAGYSVRLPFSVSIPGGSLTTAGDPPEPGPPPVPAAPAPPANTVSGSASYDGQAQRFTHGLAWWDAENNQVSLGFFDHAPRAGLLAELRTGSWGEGGPTMTLWFRFEGAPRPDPAAITYCFVSTDWPKGGSLSNNTDGKGCGVVQVGGELKAGGHVTAKVKGQATGPRGPYSWDLAFNLPIAK
jgi:hypothetical protein